MSFLQVFEQLAGVIIDDAMLTEARREDEIMRLADLFNFIGKYDPAIRVIETNPGRFTVVDDGGVRKAILICDFSAEVKGRRGNPVFDPAAFTAVRNDSSVMEVWFVIVEECLAGDHVDECRLFIQHSGIHQHCDKAFHFNYSDSLIIQLI